MYGLYNIYIYIYIYIHIHTHIYLLCTPVAEVRVEETGDAMLAAKTADIQHMPATLGLNCCRLPAGHMPAEAIEGTTEE